jgi:hypothetical protein
MNSRSPSALACRLTRLTKVQFEVSIGIAKSLGKPKYIGADHVADIDELPMFWHTVDSTQLIR